SPARSSSSPQRCAVAGAVYRSRDARLTATLAQECTCPSALHADTSTVSASRRTAKLKRRTTGRRSSPDAYSPSCSFGPRSEHLRESHRGRRGRLADLEGHSCYTRHDQQLALCRQAI